jgi:hypothetical protein
MELENGKYRAKAVTGQWGIGKAGTGTPQVGIQFELLDRGGESITWYGFLSDKALPVTVKALRACGWEGADLSDLTGLDTHEVTLVVENEEYNDKWSPRVKFVNSNAGLSMNNVLEGDGLKAFAAEMRAKILGIDPSSAKKHASPTKRPEPPPPGDADAPF